MDSRFGRTPRTVSSIHKTLCFLDNTVINVKSKSGLGIQNIRATPNQTPEVTLPGTPVTLVDRPPILLINAPKPPPATPQIEYKDDKGTGTEDFVEPPKEKSHCGLYTAYCFIVLIYTILCFVIYTFVLYGIGTAFLKSHYHISIDGKTLSLNSLDVLRYPGVYSVFSTPQTTSIKRELNENNDKNNENILDLDNIEYSVNKVKALTPNNRRTAIIDGQNDLFLRSKGLETTDVSIDGKTKMLGDVLIGDSNHTNNLKINGTIDVQSVKVNNVIDLSDATLKYNAPNPDTVFAENYQNISIGQLDAKVINVQNTLCNITVNDITNINDLLFLRPNVLTVRSGNLVLRGDKEGNGRITMQTDVDALTMNTEYMNIGLKDSEKKINIRGDDNSIKNVNNLESDYITSKSIKVSEINAVLDTIKMKNIVDMDGNLLKTTKIQNSDTIQTLNINPLDDKNFISLYGINVNENREMTNILKFRTSQLFTDEIQVSNAGSISIKSDLNLNNDFSISNVKTVSTTNLDVTKLSVNSIQSKDAANPISVESDMLCNRIVKINEIDPTNVGNIIKVNGDLSLQNKVITDVVDILTDKLTVKNIASKHNDGAPISVNSEVQFNNAITAGTINVVKLKDFGGSGIIKVDSDLNLENKKITSGTITVNTILAKDLNTLDIGTNSGTTTLYGTVKYNGGISGSLNMNGNKIVGIGSLQSINAATPILLESQISMLNKNIDMGGNTITNIGTLTATTGSSISIASNVYMPRNELIVQSISSNNPNGLTFNRIISFGNGIKIEDDKITGIKTMNTDTESLEIKGTVNIGSIKISNSQINMDGNSITNVGTISSVSGNALTINGIDIKDTVIEKVSRINDGTSTLTVLGTVNIKSKLVIPSLAGASLNTDCDPVGSFGYSGGVLYFCDENKKYKAIAYAP